MRESQRDHKLIVKTIKCQVFVMSLSFYSQILKKMHCSVLCGDSNVNIWWRSNPRSRSICNSNPLYLYLLLPRLPAHTWYGDCKILASLFAWGKLQLGKSVAAFHAAHSEQNVSGQLCLGITGIWEPWATRYQWELKRHSDILITSHPPESRVEVLYLICFFLIIADFLLFITVSK